MKFCKPYFFVIWHISRTYWIVQKLDHLTCHAFLFMTINHYLHHSLSQNCVTCQTIKFFKVVAKCIVGAADKSPSNKDFVEIGRTEMGYHTQFYWAKGSCQVKKFKNQRKTRIGRTTTTHPSIHFFYFFWETCTAKKQHRKTQNFRVGTWPTHPLPSFSRIFGFFLTWQNP